MRLPPRGAVGLRHIMSEGVHAQCGLLVHPQGTSDGEGEKDGGGWWCFQLGSVNDKHTHLVLPFLSIQTIQTVVQKKT